jgi:hypothetical protein
VFSFWKIVCYLRARAVLREELRRAEVVLLRLRDEPARAVVLDGVLFRADDLLAEVLLRLLFASPF